MRILRVSPVLLLVSASVVFAGCGDDETPQPEAPTKADVIDYYGLGPGSCFRYRLGQAFATVTIEGPNETAFTNYTTYVRSYQLDSGGQPVEEYFDMDTEPGSLLLLRRVSGTGSERTTKNYVEVRPESDREGTVGPAPAFLRLVRDRTGEIVTEGTEFQTAAAPLVTVGGSTTLEAAEEHTWADLGDKEVAVPTGTSTATEYSYRTPEGGSRWALVRGFGFAEFTDFDGNSHQVCDARVCDSNNNCTGPASCAELFCQ